MVGRANRRPGELEPFARNAGGVATRGALALEHAGSLLRPIGEKTGRVRPDAFKQRLRPGSEFRSCRCRAHRADEAGRQRALFKRFPVAGFGADGGVIELVCQHVDDTRASVSCGEINSSACRSLEASVAQHSPMAPQLAARLGQPIETRIFSGTM